MIAAKDDNRFGKRRFKRRFEVLMRRAGERFSGYLSNISNEGMEVRARERMQVNDELSIRVITSEGDRFNYLSEVRWWRPAIGSKMGKGIFRYGLQHMAVDPEHAQLMDIVKYDPVRRNVARIDAQLPVEVKSSAKHLEAVTENISTEGVFLRFDELPPPYRDEHLTLSIDLKDTEETPLLVDVKVIHLLQQSWADKLGLPTGVGLHFINVSEETKARLNRFIQQKSEESTPASEEAENPVENK